MDGHDVLQWDVLHGTYELQEDTALCQWQRHLNWKVSMEQSHDSPTDRGWEEMDPRASLKWQCIRLPGNADDAEFRARIAGAASDAASGLLHRLEMGCKRLVTRPTGRLSV